jgi:tRNA-splicing ligase RtcB
MRVDGLIFADDVLIEAIRNDQSPEQVANVATLPGIQYASLAMPDIHWGYGFCIGGVCATDPAEGGVISPGGVGYDINCGVRLVRSNLFYRDVEPRLPKLMDELFREVPAGVGRGGRFRFNRKELKQLLAQGPALLQGRDLATDADIEHTEAQGRLAGADPDQVSQRALERGSDQCGTLGSGNHFLEVQVVEAIFDDRAARTLGLEKDMVCVMVHSGSRGLGYQVCDDALKRLRNVPEKYGIELPDRQLVCAPVESKEGQSYLGAMGAAANFAWCNRQLLMAEARNAFATVFGRPWEKLRMSLVYDVAHNIAKCEQHMVEGQSRRLWVHRKGATRAFPPGHPELPHRYREIGQPVLIPGDMGRASWVLVGNAGSMQRSFGTACHGAGRVMSRTAAVRRAKGRRIDRELLSRGVHARARSWRGLAEEQPEAYKDVNLVVDVVDRSGLASKVARMRPIGVVKG